MQHLFRRLKRWLTRSPQEQYEEDYEVLIRLARRCAYDFAHAVDFLPDDDSFGGRICRDMRWQKSAIWWTKVFAKGNPGKDYRVGLQRQIEEQRWAGKRLIEQLREAGVSPDDRACMLFEPPF